MNIRKYFKKITFFEIFKQQNNLFKLCIIEK